MGWEASGIDFDDKAVDVARNQGLNVSCASVEDLVESNEQYDVITISHVIEHVYNPASLLANSYRLLKPGGRLWLETPNIQSMGASRFGRAWRGLEVPRHLALFNPSSLKASLEHAGFEALKWHWHGIVSLSIHTASATIERGHCALDAVPQVIPPVTAFLSELTSMLRPGHREFLTVTALKSP